MKRVFNIDLYKVYADLCFKIRQRGLVHSHHGYNETIYRTKTTKYTINLNEQTLTIELT
jgi:hypothetical protein